MTRYKGRASSQSIERSHPHVVEMEVPPGGFGQRLDAMHEWIAGRGADVRPGPGRYEEGQWFISWCFADAGIAAAFKDEFASNG